MNNKKIEEELKSKIIGKMPYGIKYFLSSKEAKKYNQLKINIKFIKNETNTTKK